MQKVNNSDLSSLALPVLPLPNFSTAESKTPNLTVSRIALPTQLEGMVENLRDAKFAWVTPVPGVHQDISPEEVIQHVMNLTLISSSRAKTEIMDPKLFFQQMGCEHPPTTCTSEYLKGFYSLTGSCLLSDWITIRDFLGFDMYLNLKKMHKSASDDLKPTLQEMIKEWCRVRARATHSIPTTHTYLSYLKDVSQFRTKLLSTLAIKKDSTNIEYRYPKIVAKINRNYQFLMQFIKPEHSHFLSAISVSQLSGTHTMVPKNATRLQEVLENIYDFAEFGVESRRFGHSAKLLSTDLAILSDILTSVRTLMQAKDIIQECKNFRRHCQEISLALTKQVFSLLRCDNSIYEKGMGSVDLDVFTQQISLIRDQTKVMGLLGTVEFIYDLSYFAEGSVLSVVDSDHVLDEIYRNRIALILRSLCHEVEDFCILESILGESNASLGQLQDLRRNFFHELQNPNFFQRALDYWSTVKPTSSHMLVQYAIKNIHDVLKPITDAALDSLQKECDKLPPDHFHSISLFEETRWLAKALLLVNDMALVLKDPTVTKEIEFDPRYLALIMKYDPSKKGAQVEREEPTETKRELIPPPATCPSTPAVVQARKAAISTPVVPTASVVDRGELKDAIRGTQGDLRQLSRVLRSLLGWNIQHNGKRHPTIVDGAGRPVAPVPLTGHAGLGTVLNVANRVCDAAQAQGLTE